MPESKTQTYIDPMAEMIAQIRQEERNSARIDIAISMHIGGEPAEKIAKYTRLSFKKVREAIAVWEDMAQQESEMKSRAMNFRYRQPSDFPATTDQKRIEGMDIPYDRKKHLLQMLGSNPGARADQ